MMEATIEHTMMPSLIKLTKFLMIDDDYFIFDFCQLRNLDVIHVFKECIYNFNLSIKLLK